MTENAAKSIHQGASFQGLFSFGEETLPDCVHPFQLQKPILDRCGVVCLFFANNQITHQPDESPIFRFLRGEDEPIVLHLYR